MARKRAYAWQASANAKLCYSTFRLLRKQYDWSEDYTRTQKWCVHDAVNRLGHKHLAEWLAHHIHRQYSPIYL